MGSLAPGSATAPYSLRERRRAAASRRGRDRRIWSRNDFHGEPAGASQRKRILAGRRGQAARTGPSQQRWGGIPAGRPPEWGSPSTPPMRLMLQRNKGCLRDGGGNVKRPSGFALRPNNRDWSEGCGALGGPDGEAAVRNRSPKCRTRKQLSPLKTDQQVLMCMFRDSAGLSLPRAIESARGDALPPKIENWR